MTVYKRLVRIVADKVDPQAVRVYDATTGEEITNIEHITIRLKPGETNEADITYLDEDESGKILLVDGRPAEHTETASNVEIDVVAMETIKESDE